MAARVAVVGAGIAGVGVAHALREAAVDVTVFEKSLEVSGRAATRRSRGCVYDYGANYVRADDGWLLDVLEEADASERAAIEEPVWTFDADGTISESDRQRTRWTFADGIDQLGKALLTDSEATVHRETRIADLERTGDGWRLVDAEGRRWGKFDALVLTPPAPQTADLIGGAEWRHNDSRRIREAIESVPYRTVVSVALHYDRRLDVPYFALVNAEKTHDVWWCSREECKPGHVPDGESLLVVQLSPDWSADHFHEPGEDLVDSVADLTADLLERDWLRDPDWSDYHHWRYAQPERAVDEDVFSLAADHELYLAGDWVAGEGRVHRALKTGLETGREVEDALD